MNEDPKNRPGILLEVSTADFLDRYVIEQVRSQRSQRSLPPQWRDETVNKAKRLIEQLESDGEIIHRLRTVHSDLWSLEAEARSPNTESNFVDTARKILTLNDERHRIKATIEDLLPNRCASIRIY